MERSVCADSPVSTVSTHHKNGPGLCQYARVNSTKRFRVRRFGPTKVQQDWKLYRMLLLLEAEC